MARAAARAAATRYSRQLKSFFPLANYGPVFFSCRSPLGLYLYRDMLRSGKQRSSANDTTLSDRELRKVEADGVQIAQRTRHSNRAADTQCGPGSAPAPLCLCRVARSARARLHAPPAQRRPPIAQARTRQHTSCLASCHPACWRFAGAIATELTKHAEDHAAMTSLRRAVNSVMCAPPHPSRPSPGLLRARVPLPCSGRPVPEHTVACAACVRVSLRACRSCSCVWLLTGSLRPCIPAPR